MDSIDADADADADVVFVVPLLKMWRWNESSPAACTFFFWWWWGWCGCCCWHNLFPTPNPDPELPSPLLPLLLLLLLLLLLSRWWWIGYQFFFPKTNIANLPWKMNMIWEDKDLSSLHSIVGCYCCCYWYCCQSLPFQSRERHSEIPTSSISCYGTTVFIFVLLSINATAGLLVKKEWMNHHTTMMMIKMMIGKRRIYASYNSFSPLSRSPVILFRTTPFAITIVAIVLLLNACNSNSYD